MPTIIVDLSVSVEGCQPTSITVDLSLSTVTGRNAAPTTPNMPNFNNGGDGGGGVFQIRRVELSDRDKGYLELMRQLIGWDYVYHPNYLHRFQALAKVDDDHQICVMENTRTGMIVASGSVFIDRKFDRTCRDVAYVEDVVVDLMARGLYLGKRVVEYLTNFASSSGCYKACVMCSDENIPFYKKCGFKKQGVQMVNE